MLIKLGYEIALDFPQPTATVLMLYLHPSRLWTLRSPEWLHVTPRVPIHEYRDSYGNRCGRLLAPPGHLVIRHSAYVDDGGANDAQTWDAQQYEVQDLPDDALLYLLPSRYCDGDTELRELAHSLFSGTRPGWFRVQAICDWVHRHVRFDYLLARNNRTALETYREATGVCRDYMHLAITLCRIMNIPARYCAGFLGDIGVPPAPPGDFAAWFEVFLGGQWHVFDARNNVPRIGRVLMCRGRDAADVAMTTTFGPCRLVAFQVWTDEVPESTLPVLR